MRSVIYSNTQALRLCEFEYFCDVIALSVLLCDELYKDSKKISNEINWM